ncbi:MAG: SAVED domain-containing protein [Chloroflexota bacterium]|nr:SAVED domain-containing protein [Chloroflexota bacterium]
MIKKLFMAHHSDYAKELWYVATELRLRGVVPWVDKDGGFEVADDCEPVARRAIRDECFGLMLYATKSAFSRDFIRNIELDEARKTYDAAQAAGQEYDFFGVPRGIGYKELSDLSMQAVQMDLSRMNTVSIPANLSLDPLIDPAYPEKAAQAIRGFQQRCEKLGSEVSKRVIRRGAERYGRSRISLQFRTRSEPMPDRDDDVLFIDAASLFQDGITGQDKWDRLLRGLLDVRRHIAHYYGRPRIYMHGSKHTTSAFLFGRVFSRFALEIRQTADETAVWSTDTPPAGTEPFAASVEGVDQLEGLGAPESNHGPRALFVEIASGYKDIRAGTDAHVQAGGPKPIARLRLRPNDPNVPLTLDNATCVAMAAQTYRCIQEAVRDYRCTEIHLFIASYMSFTTMLGHQFFNGVPPVHVYEWDGSRYSCSCIVPSDL